MTNQSDIERALARVAQYVEMRDAKPLRQVDDQIHGIHTGTEWEAVLFLSDVRQLLSALRTVGEERESFQSRVAPWMQECFGPEISNDRVERGDRFLEEALELLQSGGYDKERVAALVDYVWSRPVGEPAQEVGGVMVTLAAYCLAHALDMHEAGETELARIWTKVPQIRAKQATKAAAIGNSSPLPSAPVSSLPGEKVG